jgi:hypothetical protein
VIFAGELTVAGEVDAVNVTPAAAGDAHAARVTAVNSASATDRGLGSQALGGRARSFSR